MTSKNKRLLGSWFRRFVYSFLFSIWPLLLPHLFFRVLGPDCSDLPYNIDLPFTFWKLFSLVNWVNGLRANYPYNLQFSIYETNSKNWDISYVAKWPFCPWHGIAFSSLSSREEGRHSQGWPLGVGMPDTKIKINLYNWVKSKHFYE